MSITDFFSILIYYSLFVAGFIIDFKTTKSSHKTHYVFLLFIFLCFGYMTGSDWRGYEIGYNYSQDSLSNATYELGFYYLIDVFHRIIPDFWVTLALLKCIYLHSVIKILRVLSRKWVASLALLMPLSLLFMVVDNPLRYMVANIFVNYSIFFVLKEKWLWALLFMLVAPLFQVTTIIVFPLFCFILLKDRIVRINRYVLIILYLIVTVVFAFPSVITQKIEDLSNLMVVVFNTRSYSSYFVNSNSEVFTIGSALKAIIAIFVLLKKNSIINSSRFGKEICLFTIMYLFFDRILVIIPSGFRLAVPFSYFFASGIISIMEEQRNVLKKLFLPVLYFLILTSSLTRGYVYIPYSNSIYYIITEHKPYDERDRYNLDAMKKRTGFEHVHRTND